MLALVQTARISVKLLVLLLGEDPGKEETIRNVFGELYVYISGNGDPMHACVPDGKEECYTCRGEIVLEPGEQITCLPGEKPWFQTGRTGCLFYSFSTVARDDLDGFTDPGVVRSSRTKIDHGVPT